MGKRYAVGNNQLKDSQGRPILWKVPVGATPPALGDVYDALVKGATQYNYAEGLTFSTDCAASGPVDNAKPVWGPLNPPTAVAGAAYSWTVPLMAATASAGHKIDAYDAVTLPAYLTASKSADGALVISGKIPVGTVGPVVLSLRAVQENGKAAEASASITVNSVQITVLFQYTVGNKTGILRIAPGGASAPVVTIMSAPAGWSDRDAHPANPDGNTTQIGGVVYPWYCHWPTMPTDTYTAKIEYLGQTVYVSWVVASSGIETTLPVTTTPPGNEANYRIYPGSDVPLPEGDYKEYSLQLKQGLNWTDVPGVIFEIDGQKAGTTLTNNRVSVATNAIQNDSYQLRLVAKLLGIQKAEQLINIVDKTPAPTYCSVLQEAAYYINNKGTGSNSDSIGIYYLGTAGKVRLLLESLTQPGVFEQYFEGTLSVTTLTGNRAKYNHMVVQAYSQRKWRDASYKVRLQVLSGNEVIREVDMTIDMSQPSAQPITGHTCSGPVAPNSTDDPAQGTDYSGEDQDSVNYLNV